MIVDNIDMDSKLKILFWINRHLETRHLADDLVARVQPVLEGHDVVVCESEECALKEIEDADVMFGYRITPQMLGKARKLKWIQFGSAGIDHTLSPELLKSDVIITTFSGVHPIPASEHVLSLMLALSRRLNVAMKQQIDHQWDRGTIAGSAGELHGKTVGIIGLGKIGLEIARLSKAFGMKAIGTKATPSDHLPNVDEIYLPNDLDRVLLQSDYLVMVIPLTASTTALIGPGEIGHMKPGAYVINVARGQMLDTGSLIQALESGHLAGAALDVFAEEPLPADSPLWDAPNVIITPHTGGSTPEYSARGAEIFKTNFEAFTSGEEMINIFDRTRGY